jgi:hypothetical protein
LDGCWGRLFSRFLNGFQSSYLDLSTVRPFHLTPPTETAYSAAFPFATSTLVICCIIPLFIDSLLCVFHTSTSCPPRRTPTLIVASMLCAALLCSYTPPLNSAVASFPTALLINVLPPGCSSTNAFTSCITPAIATNCWSPRVHCAWKSSHSITGRLDIGTPQSRRERLVSSAFCCCCRRPFSISLLRNVLSECVW